MAKTCDGFSVGDINGNENSSIGPISISGNVGFGTSSSNIAFDYPPDSIVIDEEFLKKICSYDDECICQLDMVHNLNICSNCIYRKPIDIPNMIKKSKLSQKISDHC